MTEKRFKVHAEGYQDTDDMGYAIALLVTYYHVGNSEVGFNFDTEREAKMLCEAWNKLVEENEQSKMMIATLRNIVLENGDLEQENKELKFQCNLLQEQANEFHRGARENANQVGKLKKENKELKKETNELKQQFILLLKKLGKKNVQCSFCEHGEHYSELVDGYYEPRFICHKKGQEYTQRSFCEDWKIKVKE